MTTMIEGGSFRKSSMVGGDAWIGGETPEEGGDAGVEGCGEPGCELAAPKPVIGGDDTMGHLDEA
jgi:hypothetical protein